MFTIGQIVIANQMAKDSFYKKVQGEVVNVKNGYVEIKATKVIDKWSSDWEIHPTSCMTAAKIEHVVTA